MGIAGEIPQQQEKKSHSAVIHYVTSEDAGSLGSSR